MQDIPRNELLDKLAAGWKCRRKSWLKSLNADENDNISVSSLIADDWEGEPPEPVLLCKHTDIVTAFKELRDGAKFIRRPSWPRVAIFINNDHLKRVASEDILANDWEVWG